MDIVDPSSMQDARHIRTDSKVTSLFMSSRSSIDRAPAQCSGGHRFDSCRGLRFFSLSYARAIVDYFMFNNALSDLPKYHVHCFQKCKFRALQ